MKNKKFFFDCDGVIRNFSRSVGFEGKKEWKLPNSVWRNIDNDPKKYLYDCDAYEDVVNHVKILGLNKIVFLTNQSGKEHCEYWTRKFLEKIFGENIEIIFVSSFAEKIQLLKENKQMVLIDDYPFFFKKEGFEEIKDRLFLLERPYNEDYREHYECFYSEFVLLTS